MPAATSSSTNSKQSTGLQFEDGRQWPKAPLAPLADPAARRRFTTLIDAVFAASTDHRGG
jgi:hypothetical protein